MIVLINPPSPFLMDDLVYPPLGLLYLAGATNGIKVIDLALDPHIPKADVYGFTATTPQINEVTHIANRLDGTKIIGGAHFSATKELPPGFDGGVIGSGCAVEWHNIRGMVSGKFRAVKPNRLAIDLHDYTYFIDDIKATSLMTGFGCNYNCGFCSKPVWKSQVFQPLDIVLEEIQDIRSLGFDAIMIFDDDFTQNPDFADIVLFLKEHKIIYRCFVRSTITDDDIEILTSTGCSEVGIGIESGSDKILRIINKGSTRKRNLHTIKRLQKRGVRVKGFLILGLPSESHETIAETEEFLNEALLDDVDISIFVPYPKSPIAEQINDYDICFAEDNRLWYKGIPGKYESSVSTSALSQGDIVAYRSKLEEVFKSF